MWCLVHRQCLGRAVIAVTRGDGAVSMLPHEPSSFCKDHTDADFKTIKLHLYHQTQTIEVLCMLLEQLVHLTEKVRCTQDAGLS